MNDIQIITTLILALASFVSGIVLLVKYFRQKKKSRKLLIWGIVLTFAIPGAFVYIVYKAMLRPPEVTCYMISPIEPIVAPALLAYKEKIIDRLPESIKERLK